MRPANSKFTLRNMARVAGIVAVVIVVLVFATWGSCYTPPPTQAELEAEVIKAHELVVEVGLSAIFCHWSDAAGDAMREVMKFEDEPPLSALGGLDIRETMQRAKSIQERFGDLKRQMIKDGCMTE